jgi:hypothetical protein
LSKLFFLILWYKSKRTILISLANNIIEIYKVAFHTYIFMHVCIFFLDYVSSIYQDFGCHYGGWKIKRDNFLPKKLIFNLKTFHKHSSNIYKPIYQLNKLKKSINKKIENQRYYVLRQKKRIWRRVTSPVPKPMHWP